MFLVGHAFCICVLAKLLWLPITMYSNMRKQSSVGRFVKYHSKDNWFLVFSIFLGNFYFHY